MAADITFQTLLCPSNFKDFNDAVLRAALLRAATEQEMNYVLDDLLSAEMLDLQRVGEHDHRLGRAREHHRQREHDQRAQPVT